MDVVGNRFFARWRQQDGEELASISTLGRACHSLCWRDVAPACPVDTFVTDRTRRYARFPVAIGYDIFPTIPLARGLPRLMVLHDSAPEDVSNLRVDGFLGSAWFADRVWIIDYPGRKLYFNGSSSTLSMICWDERIIRVHKSFVLAMLL